MLKLVENDTTRVEIREAHERALRFENNRAVVLLNDAMLRSAAQIQLDAGWVINVLTRVLKHWSGELGRCSTGANTADAVGIMQRIKNNEDIANEHLKILTALLDELEHAEAQALFIEIDDAEHS
jgi:hypothetical protein